MNESTRPQRALTMTVICKSCENQYGGWRAQCPACGTSTPVKAQVVAFNTPRQVRPAKEPKQQCTFCRQPGAKQRCPTCNELIHRTCVSMHAADCEQFQRERESILATL